MAPSVRFHFPQPQQSHLNTIFIQELSMEAIPSPGIMHKRDFKCSVQINYDNFRSHQMIELIYIFVLTGSAIHSVDLIQCSESVEISFKY